MSARPTSQLRKLLKGPKLVSAPGVADALNARLVAQAGFEAIYMTGAGHLRYAWGCQILGF